MHLAIISTIRSRSVAVSRVFQNTHLFDKTYHEPLTGIYGSHHYPAICKDWLSEDRFVDVEDVVAMFRHGGRILIKDMAFASKPCIRFVNTQFLLLFRHPADVLRSLAPIVQLDTNDWPDINVLKDICGYEQLISIHSQLKGLKPMLMCTDDLTSCRRGFQHLPVDTPFLEWSKPFEAHDFKKPRYVWQWHRDAIESTSFQPGLSTHPIPKHMIEVYQHLTEYFLPHYQYLAEMEKQSVKK